MFGTWKDKRELRRIYQEANRKVNKETTSPGWPNKEAEIRVDEAIAEADYKAHLLDYQIDMRETRRLLIEANLLDIEVPTAQVWNKSQFGDFLPTSEREKLRRRIDEEKTRRRDVKAWWWKTIIGPAITTIIGLIGALTGLVAVVLSHSKIRLRILPAPSCPGARCFTAVEWTLFCAAAI